MLKIWKQTQGKGDSHHPQSEQAVDQDGQLSGTSKDEPPLNSSYAVPQTASGAVLHHGSSHSHATTGSATVKRARTGDCETSRDVPVVKRRKKGRAERSPSTDARRSDATEMGVMHQSTSGDLIHSAVGHGGLDHFGGQNSTNVANDTCGYLTTLISDFCLGCWGRPG
ncbi:hypothetical protein BV22DRAFT_656910 [Leucogyrophana mollusca]|uniref:Uncharacterized protein n=1 Tax=Leucogyrophana mollusca TaxID=85980 RepID=A0ACB8B9G2_9AGAM|nr:hypothetical protein BV22DRAFT_656910 [Leucogyrophana mollusca]